MRWSEEKSPYSTLKQQGNLGSTPSLQSPVSKRRRRHYDSSSSDYSSSPSRSRSRSPIKSNTSIVLGRKFSLPKEAERLKRDCQFVKRVKEDPALLGNLKEKAIYIKGEQPFDGNSDPRIPMENYLSRCMTNSDLPRPLFYWDNNSRGLPPVLSIMVGGFPSSVISKSLLIKLLENLLGISLTDSITEVQLSNGRALLTLRDPSTSVSIVKGLMNRKVGDDQWTACFDPGGQLFLNQSKKPLETQHPKRLTTSSQESSNYQSDQLAKKLKKLRCSSRVPCILIDYSLIPKLESKNLIENIFRKCRIYNVERAENCWHLHLTSQSEIDFALRWRNEFKLKGDLCVNFSVKLFPDPAISAEYEESSHHPIIDFKHKKSTSSRSPNIFGFEHSKLSFSSSSVGTNLDDFYKPTVSSFDISINNSSLISTPIIAEEDALSNLPIFNRRVQERKRTEEEAAAIAAEAARLALERKMQGEEMRRELKRQKDEMKKRQSRVAIVNHYLDNFKAPQHLKELENGCARLEGYFKQPSSEKIIYLEDVTKVSIAIFDPTSFNQTTANRSYRAQNRRLQFAIESLSTDLISKGSAFNSRKKRLIVGRSSIHSWGLFAGEDIEAGDFVEEYVGEIIRHSVANVRERRYEMELSLKGSSEMASSYFFRLDELYVLDATHKGNISRFINHCCDPSCVARVLTVESTKRIFMYARRDIRKGEEITYDYKFPLEEDPKKKIKCLCGARSCRGTLN